MRCRWINRDGPAPQRSTFVPHALRNSRSGARLRFNLNIRQLSALFIPPFLILVASLPTRASTGDDGYLPVGPHFFASATFESPLEYHDVLISSAPAASFTVGATYRGFALSVWHANDLSSAGSNATEAFASYSHKLPLVDLHVGAVWCSVSGRIESCKAGARVSLSSNTFRNTLMSITVDQSFTNSSRIFNVAVTQKVYSTHGIRFDVRAGATYWDYPRSAKGVSARLMAAKQIRENLTVHLFAGLIESCTTNVTGCNRIGAPIVGSSLSWSF